MVARVGDKVSVWSHSLGGWFDATVEAILSENILRANFSHDGKLFGKTIGLHSESLRLPLLKHSWSTCTAEASVDVLIVDIGSGKVAIKGISGLQLSKDGTRIESPGIAQDKVWISEYGKAMGKKSSFTVKHLDNDESLLNGFKEAFKHEHVRWTDAIDSPVSRRRAIIVGATGDNRKDRITHSLNKSLKEGLSAMARTLKFEVFNIAGLAEEDGGLLEAEYEWTSLRLLENSVSENSILKGASLQGMLTAGCGSTQCAWRESNGKETRPSSARPSVASSPVGSNTDFGARLENKVSDYLEQLLGHGEEALKKASFPTGRTGTWYGGSQVSMASDYARKILDKDLKDKDKDGNIVDSNTFVEDLDKAIEYVVTLVGNPQMSDFQTKTGEDLRFPIHSKLKSVFKDRKVLVELSMMKWVRTLVKHVLAIEAQIITIPSRKINIQGQEISISWPLASTAEYVKLATGQATDLPFGWVQVI